MSGKDIAPPPPHEPEAETAVLGSVFKGRLDEVRAILSPSDFYESAGPHAKLFRHLCKLADEGHDIEDTKLLVSRLKKADDYEKVNAGFLADVFDSVPTGANAQAHALAVKEASIKRQVYYAALEAMQTANNGVDAGALVGQFSERLNKLSRDGCSSQIPKDIDYAPDLPT